MATLQEKKRGGKVPRTPSDNCGLLDAYTSSDANIGVGEIGLEKRNPHVFDDRQKPISKKNKNRKKREQEKIRSQNEGRGSESVEETEIPQTGATDEVLDSWEDIQDVGTSESQPPPPPQFVINAKAVEEQRKRKELEEAEISRKLEQMALASKQKQSSQSQKLEGVGNSPKNSNVSTVGGSSKKNKNKSKNNFTPTKQQPQKENENKSSTKPSEEAKSTLDTSKILQQDPVELIDTDKVRSSLLVLQKTLGEVKDVFKQMPINSAPNVRHTAKQPSSVAESSEDAQKSAKVNDTQIQQEKTKEEIKEEREAKKQAKQAARAAAKDKSTVIKNEVESPEKPSQTKSQDEIDHSVKSTSNIEADVGKSKTELKAERRAKQEAQRAAKANASLQKVQALDKKSPSTVEVNTELGGKASSGKSHLSHSTHKVPDDRQADRASVEKKRLKKLASQNILPRTVAQRKVKLFDHLYQYEREYSISKPFPVVNSHIHPAVLQLGLQYAEGTIQGSNARCLAFMQTMKHLISDHKSQQNLTEDAYDYQSSLRHLSQELDTALKTHVAFLKNCRTHSVSMGNAIRFLKNKIKELGIGKLEPINMESVDETKMEEHAKSALCDSIDTFVTHIHLAAVQIADTACQKIRDGDVILTYGCSSLMREVFLVAAKRGRKFRVVVADGRPRFEGREMARHLVNAGIHTTYILVQSVSYIITEVTKVFLGAHAVLANGCVMSRVGTSQVALIAKAQNVPVLVCCETYKFSEKVQTDSFVFNELGDPDDLVATGSKINALEEWRDLSKLCLLNLSYDVTPASLVDAIISEISVIPTTSVPVVLRLKAMEDHTTS